MSANTSIQASLLGGTVDPALIFNANGTGAVKVDSQGNYYVCVPLNASGVFKYVDTNDTNGTESIDSAGSMLVKYANGDIIWRVILKSNTVLVRNISIDASDNIYLGMIASSTVTLIDTASTSTAMGIPPNAAGNFSIIVKLNSSGVRQFNFYPIQTTTGAHTSLITDMACYGTDLYVQISKQQNGTTSQYGDIYSMNGYFRTTTTQAAGVENVYLIKYNSLGGGQWAFNLFNSAASLRGLAMCIDSSGNIYNTGSLSSDNTTYTLNSLSGNASESASAYQITSTVADSFITCHNSSGAAQWAVLVEGIGTESGRGIVANSVGVFTSFHSNSSSLSFKKAGSIIGSISLDLATATGVSIISRTGTWIGGMSFNPTSGAGAGFVSALGLSRASDDSILIGLGYNCNFIFRDTASSTTSFPLSGTSSSGLVKVSPTGVYVNHWNLQGTNNDAGIGMAPTTAVDANNSVIMSVPMGNQTSGNGASIFSGKVLSIVFTPNAITGNFWERLIDFNSGTGTYFFIAPTYNSGYFRAGLRYASGTESNFTSSSAVITSTSTKYIVNVYFDTNNIWFSVGTVNGSTIAYLDINGPGVKYASLSYSTVGATRSTLFNTINTYYFGKSAYADPYLSATYHKISAITPASSTSYYTDTNLTTYTDLTINNTVITYSTGSWYVFNNGVSAIRITTGSWVTTTTTGLTIAAGSSQYFYSPVSVVNPLTITNALGSTVASVSTATLSTVAFGSRSTLVSRFPSVSIPGAPTIGTATAGNAQATVTFTAPTITGGTITSYRITSSPGGKTVDVSGTATSGTVIGLSNGTAYTFTVTATNAAGTSSSSTASNSVTPITVPGAPASTSASTNTTTGVISLSWTAPSDNGGASVTSYNVYYKTYANGSLSNEVLLTGSSTPSFSSTGATSAIITGATMGAQTFISVAAVNSVGTGTRRDNPPFTPTRIPDDVSGAPVAIFGNQSAVLTWSWKTAAPTGGSPFTRFDVGVYNGSSGAFIRTAQCSVNAEGTAETTVSGLTNGQLYKFRVKGVTIVGSSANDSSFSNVIQPDALPTGSVTISGTPNVGQTLTTNAAALADDDTLGTLSYQWQLADASSGVWSNVSDATSATYVPLTAHIGKYYRVLVSYTDGAGITYTGATAIVSSVSGPVAARAPYAPTSVSAVAGSSNATISWSAPMNDGGSNITKYTVISQTLMNMNNMALWVSSAYSQDASANTTSHVFTGLTAGTLYRFIVVAVNAYGEGDTSIGSNGITPYTTSSAPQNATVTAGKERIDLAWSEPSFNGYSDITSYRISYTINNGLPVSIDISAGGFSDLSYSMTGLTAGDNYRITIGAINEADVGDLTSELMATPYTTPGAPQSVTVTAGYTSGSGSTMIVNWSAPISDGYNTITEYRITDGSGNTQDVSTGMGNTYTFTGLTANRTYSYTVKAKNAAEYGAESSPAATATAYGLPGAPTGVSAVAGNAQATVSWTGAAAANSSTVTKYTITANPGGTTKDVSGDVSSGIVTDLSNGTAYTFTVTATNAAGPGPASTASAAVTPDVVPAAPTGVSAAAGEQSVTVSWSAPISNGGTALLGYKVYNSESPASPVADVSASILTTSIAGLTAGSAYSFYVVAYNVKGVSAASTTTASVVPYTTPSEPLNVTATPGSSKVTVSWSAPASDGYSQIISYRITDGSGTSVDVPANVTSREFTGLTANVSYSYRVKAKNASVSYGTESAAVLATPYTNPGQPTNVVATAGNKQATVTWAAAAANSSTIANYRVISTPDSVTSDVNGDITSAVVTGLRNGVAYTFTVTATNVAGEVGQPSVASAPLNPVPNADPSGTFVVVDLNAGDGYSYGVGHTLSTNNGIADEDGISSEFSYKWQIADTSSGTFTDISGATSGTYVVFAANVGKYFRTIASYTDGIGKIESKMTTNVAGPSVPVPPAAPASVSAIKGYLNATVSWTSPVTDGGSTIMGYRVKVGSTVVADVSANTMSTTIYELTAGLSYAFSVVAYNTAGVDGALVEGAATTASAVVPYTKPGAPTGVTANKEKLSASVSWIDPSDGWSDIQFYTVKVYLEGSRVVGSDVSGTTSPILVSGLTKNANYTFKVSATNAAEEGPDSTASSAITPYDVPGAPTINEVYNGGNHATSIWFTAGDSNSSVITHYKIVATVVDTSEQVVAIVDAPTYILLGVTGLRNGVPYSFYIQAINAAGEGPASNIVSTDYAGNPLIMNAPPVDNVSIVLEEDGDSYEFYYVGQILTTNISTNPSALTDADGISGEISYQWCTIDDNNYPNVYYNDISGETSSTLTLTADHVNYPIGLKLSYIDGAGTHETVHVRQYTNYIEPLSPTEPTSVNISSAEGEITISWGDVSFNGGAPVQGFKVYLSYYDNWEGWSSILLRQIEDSSVYSATLTWTDMSFNIGDEYSFFVRAYNSAGDSAASENVSATFFLAPTPILRYAAEYYTEPSGQIMLGWDMPMDIPSWMFARYEIYDVSSNTKLADLGISDRHIDGVLGGITLRIKVRSVISYADQEYTSAFSEPSEEFTTVSRPDAPTDIEISGGNGTLTVSWGAPANTGGRTITSYYVEYIQENELNAAGSTYTDGNTFSYTFSNVSNGYAYTASVKAFTTYDTKYYDDYNVYIGSESVTITGITGAQNTPVNTVPLAPSRPSAVTGAESAIVTWDVTNNAQADITKYIIYSNPSDKSLEVLVADTTTPTTSHTISGLKNGTSYTFTVVAQNAAGASEASEPSADPVVPRSVPSAPKSITVTPVIEDGGSAITVEWVDGSDNGAVIDNYRVWAIDISADTTVADISGVTSPVTISGLTNGKVYNFRVAAHNDAGWGPSGESTPESPYTYPSVVSDLVVTGANGCATLNWTVPASNGRAITEFKIYYDNTTISVTDPSGEFTGGAAVSTVINSITPKGTNYSFIIRSRNQAGLGEVSDPAEALVYGTPASPTNLTCQEGQANNTLSWTAPTDTGYLPIHHYLLIFTAVDVSGTIDISSDITSYEHTGLTPGITYTYYIYTVTAADAVSSAEGPATGKPYEQPGQPTDIQIDPSDSSVLVSWSAPTNFGGADASGYLVEISDQDGMIIAQMVVASTESSVVITGLTNGYSYRARITASNLYLSSEPTAWTSYVIPCGLPDAPTNVTATKGKNSILLSWSAPTYTGGIGIALSGYNIYNITDNNVTPVTDGSTSALITGLADGTSYTFKISAYDENNHESLPSESVSATTNSVPSGSLTISGDFTQGAVLTAVTSGLSDADSLGDFTYQWQATGTEDDIFIDLSGEESSTLTTTQSMVNRKIRVIVRYVDNAGVLETVYSTEISTRVANVNDPGSGVDISGVAAYQQNIEANTTDLSDADGLPSPLVLSYQWFRSADGVTDIAITDATADNYTVTRDDVNYRLLLRVSYTDSFGGANDVYSPYTSVVPKVAPTAPRGLIGTRGDKKAILTWTGPEWNGGTTDISYNIYRTDISDTYVVSDLSSTVEGLTNGITYSFYVIAQSDGGWSSASNTVTVKPGAVPSAVGSLEGVYSVDSPSVTLSWTAPSNDNGYAIVSYNIYTDDNLTPITSTLTSVNITGLTYGKAYTFHVKAVNDIGEGADNTVTITPSTYPDPPTGVTVTPSYTSSPAAIVSWAAPADNGGAAIDKYEVRLSDGTVLGSTTDGSTTTLTISGLTALTSYRFSVYSHNKNGYSTTPGDPGADITAYGPPQAPTGLTADYGNSKVILSWNAVTDNAANGLVIKDYDISVGSTRITGITGLSAEVTGLTNGMNYTFYVRARNQNDLLGAASSIVEHPNTTPSAPQSFVATHGNTQVVLSWLAPNSSGGDAIAGYTINAWRTDTPATVYTKTVGVVTSTTITDLSGGVTPLVNGVSYTFQIAAYNRSGAARDIGIYTATASAIPRTVPTSPKNLSAEFGNTSITLSWQEPDSSGGAVITGYYVYKNSIKINSLIEGTTSTITGLTNGTTYNFTVKAVNSEGESAESNIVSEKPNTSPSTPSTLAAAAFENAINLNYAAYENGARIYNTDSAYYGPNKYDTRPTPSYSYSEQWVTEGLIMNGTTNRNTKGRSTDKNGSNATTWYQASGGNRYIIVDLGSERTFDSAYGYQTFSDGKTTHLGLSYVPPNAYTDTDSRLTYSSNTWVSIFSNAPMTNARSGYNLEKIFSPVTTRYIRVTAMNDLSIDANAPFIELFNIKLFATPDPNAGDQKIPLAWSAPADGGDTINQYTIIWSAGGVTVGSVDLSGTASTYTIEGLTNGTAYTVSIKAYNRNAEPSTSTSITATPGRPPLAPTDLIADGYARNGYIDLSWNHVDLSSGRALSGFSIYTYNNATDVLVSTTTSATTSARVSGLTNGTVYRFVVKAQNSLGYSSASNSTTEYSRSVPTAPVLGAFGHSDGSITVNWSMNNTSGLSIIKYYIYLDDMVAPAVVDISSTRTSYTFTGLTNGTTYSFAVEAFNELGSTRSSTGTEKPSKAPEAPTELTLNTYTINSITVRWTASVDNGASITTYKVYRATSSGGSYSQVGSSAITSYTDSGLTTGYTYYYKIIAVNRDGNSAYSAEGSQKPSAIPSVPTNMVLVGHTAQNILMSWTASATNGDAVTYEIYRSTTNSNYITLDGTTTNTSYTSSDLSSGVTYYFKVGARNRDNSGVPLTLSTTYVTEYPSKKPDAPVLSISSFGNGFIQLAWTAPANNGDAITGYKLYDASTNTLIFDASSNVLSYRHEGLTIGVRRYYYVIATNRDGDSAHSTTVDEIPSLAPSKPFNLAIQREPGKFILTWETNSNGEPIIAREIYNAATDEKITAGLTISGDSAIITRLPIGMFYSFKVRVQTRVDWSPLSEASISTELLTYPDSIQNVIAIKGDGIAYLTWTTTGMYTGGTALYNVTYHVYSADEQTPYTIESADKNGCTVLGLTNGTLYSFVVKVNNGVAYSVASAATNEITPGTDLVIGDTFVKVDPVITNVPFIGAVIAPEASAPDTVTFVPPRPDVYPTVSIANIPAADSITRVVVATVPPQVIPNTINKSVIIDVTFYNGDTQVSELSSPVTLLINIPGMTADKLSLYHRATEESSFTFVGYATRVTESFYSFTANKFSPYKAVEEKPIPCIVDGTRVLTQEGYKAVEELTRKDRIITSAGKAVRFALLKTIVEETTEKNAPYMIPAHCFSRNYPPAPVTLSGHHAIEIRRGVWHFPAMLAKIYSGIRQVDIGKKVTYYHIKLPNYLSDNLVVEGGAVLESLGGSQKYADVSKIYRYSERLRGYTRISASEFDRIRHS